MDPWVSPIVTCNGDKYFLSFVDDCMHFIWMFPLKTKDEITAILSYFQCMIGYQFGVTIKAFQDGEGSSNKLL